MNRYTPQIPRSAFTLAAIALMAATFALGILAPAKSDSSHQAAALATVSKDVEKAPIETALSPSRIEVIGVREKLTAGEPAPHIPAKTRQAG